MSYLLCILPVINLETTHDSRAPTQATLYRRPVEAAVGISEHLTSHTLPTTCKGSSGYLRASHRADLLPVEWSSTDTSLKAILSEQYTELRELRSRRSSLYLLLELKKVHLRQENTESTEGHLLENRNNL